MFVYQVRYKIQFKNLQLCIIDSQLQLGAIFAFTVTLTKAFFQLIIQFRKGVFVPERARMFVPAVMLSSYLVNIQGLYIRKRLSCNHVFIVYLYYLQSASPIIYSKIPPVGKLKYTYIDQCTQTYGNNGQEFVCFRFNLLMLAPYIVNCLLNHIKVYFFH